MHFLSRTLGSLVGHEPATNTNDQETEKEEATEDTQCTEDHDLASEPKDDADDRERSCSSLTLSPLDPIDCTNTVLVPYQLLFEDQWGDFSHMIIKGRDIRIEKMSPPNTLRIMRASRHHHLAAMRNCRRALLSVVDFVDSILAPMIDICLIQDKMCLAYLLHACQHIEWKTLLNLILDAHIENTKRHQSVLSIDEKTGLLVVNTYFKISSNNETVDIGVPLATIIDTINQVSTALGWLETTANVTRSSHFSITQSVAYCVALTSNQPINTTDHLTAEELRHRMSANKSKAVTEGTIKFLPHKIQQLSFDPYLMDDEYNITRTRNTDSSFINIRFVIKLPPFEMNQIIELQNNDISKLSLLCHKLKFMTVAF